MVKLTTLDISARNELVKKTKGYQEREALREAIANLAKDKTLQLEPEADETLRKLKVAVKWAAKEVNQSVAYGESARGTLLVWIDQKEQAPSTTTPAGKKRGRPKKSADAVPSNPLMPDVDSE